MMKVTFPILLSVTFFSCINRSSIREENPIYKATSKEVDTTYVRTGLYYLTEEGAGIRKKCESDGQVYSLAKIPFASVDNISRTEIKMDKVEDKAYPNLCLHFDEKGRKDLEEGTGNPLHPHVAAVIAGKLVYVVDNRPESKARTGTLCIIIEGAGIGVSWLELEAMKRAVDEKR